MNKNDLTVLFLEQDGLATDPATIKKHIWLWWYNPVSSSSLRLTCTGHEFLYSKLKLAHYDYKLKKDLLNTAKVYIWLDKYLTVPYYLPNRSNIVFYGEKDAMMLGLHGGDLESYLENFTK